MRAEEDDTFRQLLLARIVSYHTAFMRGGFQKISVLHFLKGKFPGTLNLEIFADCYDA